MIGFRRNLEFVSHFRSHGLFAYSDIRLPRQHSPKFISVMMFLETELLPLFHKKNLNGSCLVLYKFTKSSPRTFFILRLQLLHLIIISLQRYSKSPEMTFFVSSGPLTALHSPATSR